MSLQTMPNDILLAILQRVTSWEIINLLDFKQQLYLLTVFQRLRAVALPKVYNYMHFEFIRYEVRHGKRYESTYPKTFAEFISTNADIIGLANCSHVVKSAKIYIFGLSRTYAELYKTIEALKSFAGLWPNIAKLKISIENQDCSNNPSETLAMQPHIIVEKYSQDLSNIMSGVTELTLTSIGYGSLAKVLYSRVAGAYASQLVKLSNGKDYYYTGGYKLGVIQHLYINMGCKYKLPRVNSHSLVSLRIENIPANVSWAPFMDDKDHNVVEFSCLKKLRLKFRKSVTAGRANANFPECQLKFPELSSLTVVCNADACPFFNMAVFPNEMDDINISAPVVLLAQIKKAGMPVVKKFTSRCLKMKK